MRLTGVLFFVVSRSRLDVSMIEAGAGEADRSIATNAKQSNANAARSNDSLPLLPCLSFIPPQLKPTFRTQFQPHRRKSAHTSTTGSHMDWGARDRDNTQLFPLTTRSKQRCLAASLPHAPANTAPRCVIRNLLDLVAHEEPEGRRSQLSRQQGDSTSRHGAVLTPAAARARSVDWPVTDAICRSGNMGQERSHSKT